MDLKIAGKLALVTGASQGIGRAVAKGLAAEGARVILSARGEEALGRAVEDIRLAGGEAFGVAADVSRDEEIETLVERVRQYYGDPGIVVVNAGGPPAGLASEVKDESWAKGYELTLMSAVRLARAAVPAMRESGWGRIITITSISVREPVARLTLSNAFRAAVTGFAKTLAGEVAAHGVTVNNVAPGYTATERLGELFKDQEALDALVGTIPARRLARPEEIAAAAVFLASEQAAYITGQTVLIDGGLAGSVF
ncbi:MAG: SDR family oxidoreductase [Deinococcota bacterium]|jgi:3-oxoacyl-[acyl-carrier protein] reductase|nr:SDR family oxidoreductase [Deinococcota bacterium]